MRRSTCTGRIPSFARRRATLQAGHPAQCQERSIAHFPFQRLLIPFNYMTNHISRSTLLCRLASLAAALSVLGAGCAAASNAPVTSKPTSTAALPPGMNQAQLAAEKAGLLPGDQSGAVDPDFTAGSDYMRETPQRYQDLKGKKPFILYFYADFNKTARTDHDMLVKLFDAEKFSVPLLRVDYKDNQVTDEGVQWVKDYNVTSTDGQVFIAIKADGTEATRFTGEITAGELQVLMDKANGK